MAILVKPYPSEDNLIGKSHWWGAPDLPEDMPYPYVTIDEGTEDEYYEPLTFVCQIRLSDIAEHDPEGLLPHTGILYFFASLDYFLGDCESPLDYHTPPVVLYSAQETGLKPYDLHWEDTGESVFSPAEAIEFQKGEQGVEYAGHVMAAKPFHDDMAGWHPGCISLLQIDEESRWNMRFFDCGMYYFLISEEALRNREWDKVEGDLFTY